jgi:nitrate/nitrite-specific signal transduction histidine kinase
MHQNQGVDPTFLTAKGRQGHFRLPGMRERAKLIGGKLRVWSALDSGTEIELSVPASHAYTASLSPGRSWFADKFAGSGRRLDDE